MENEKTDSYIVAWPSYHGFIHEVGKDVRNIKSNMLAMKRRINETNGIINRPYIPKTISSEQNKLDARISNIDFKYIWKAIEEVVGIEITEGACDVETPEALGGG